MKNLIIIGAGGFGREVAWLVERINDKNRTWEIEGFLDDNSDIHNSVINGYPVLGGLEQLKKYNGETYFICTIGSSIARKRFVERLIDEFGSLRFATLIDPTVQYSKSVEIGEGSILCAGTVLTVDIYIGRHVIINLNTTVGHDSDLNNYVTLYPGVNLSGGTALGECAEIGTGAQVLQGLGVRAGAIVGAGAVVTKDITEAGTYVGIPARRVK